MKRFEIAYQKWFDVALSEIRQGRKQSNWMSYIFPQIYGLRTFEPENSYSICSKQQAIEFLEHPVLGEKFRDICTELLNLKENDINKVFNELDVRKLHSSLTLFDAIKPNDIFKQLLEKYPQDEQYDKNTLCRLTLSNRVQNALEYIKVDPKDFNIVPSMYTRPRGEAMHRFSHIYRVMIGTALIAYKIKEPRLGLLAFISAYIHDLARINDGNDPTHGRRAAETILPTLTNLLSNYNISKEEYDIIAKATTYHCEPIQERLSMDCFKVCKILSDADALDRCRFYGDESRLNVDCLRFEESKLCITPIDFICKESVRQDKIKKEIPFEEFLKLAEF